MRSPVSDHDSVTIANGYLPVDQHRSRLTSFGQKSILDTTISHKRSKSVNGDDERHHEPTGMLALALADYHRSNNDVSDNRRSNGILARALDQSKISIPRGGILANALGKPPTFVGKTRASSISRGSSAASSVIF